MNIYSALLVFQNKKFPRNGKPTLTDEKVVWYDRRVIRPASRKTQLLPHSFSNTKFNFSQTLQNRYSLLKLSFQKSLLWLGLNALHFVWNLS